MVAGVERGYLDVHLAGAEKGCFAETVVNLLVVHRLIHTGQTLQPP